MYGCNLPDFLEGDKSDFITDPPSSYRLVFKWEIKICKERKAEYGTFERGGKFCYFFQMEVFDSKREVKMSLDSIQRYCQLFALNIYTNMQEVLNYYFYDFAAILHEQVFILSASL